MDKCIFSTLLLSLLFIIKPACSDTNYWQCAVHDKENKQWEARSTYERVATNKAFEACKKESHVPASCKPIEESCEYSGNGKNTNRGWQCTAFDQMAKIWVGQIYRNKDDAAIDATTYCQTHSSIPDSCYTNFLTCKDR